MSARRWLPDVVVFPTLVALAVLLFANVRTIPDYVAGRPAAPAAAPSGERSGPAVQDFAYNFNYARSAAQQRSISPYSVTEHRRFLTAWLGPEIASSACFGYGPTIVLVWGPLFILPTAWAWLAWNVVGAGLATSAVRATADDRRSLALGRLALLMPSAFYCLVLGQTALFTTGVLGALVLFLHRRTSATACGAAACLFILTMKPPLALTAGAAAVAAGAWLTVLVGGVATLAMLGAAILWWSVDVIPDYGALLAHYNLVDAPALFRAGFHPEFMTNLRNVLLHTGRFDDGSASRITWIPLLVTLAIPAIVALVRRRPARIEHALAWTATAYTLFAPHVTPTEDLIMVLVLLWLWPACGALARAVLASLCIAVELAGGSTFAVLSSLGASPPNGALLPVAAFGAKVVVAALSGHVLLHAEDGPIESLVRR